MKTEKKRRENGVVENKVGRYENTDEILLFKVYTDLLHDGRPPPQEHL